MKRNPNPKPDKHQIGLKKPKTRSITVEQENFRVGYSQYVLHSLLDMSSLFVLGTILNYNKVPMSTAMGHLTSLTNVDRFSGELPGR